MLLGLFIQLVHASQDPGGSWEELQRVLSPQPSAEFGWDVTLLGEVNQDGCSDYLVGAPGEVVSGVNGAGSIYVISGADGQIIRQHSGLNTGDQLGWAVFSVGDVNHDGIPEYGATMPSTGPGVIGAQVFDGMTGVLLHQVFTPLDGQGFGHDADGVGDWNADGVYDYAISDHGHNVNGMTQVGTVYVYSGLDGTLIQEIDGVASGHSFGQGIRGGGDVNGDGRLDLLVWNAWGYGDSVDVIDGASGSMHYRLSSLTGNGYLGTGLDFVPDLDGDGMDEILVGAANAGSHEQGEAYLFSGRTGALIYRWYGETTYRASFGIDVSCIGDQDWDGVPDIAVGSYGQVFPTGQGKVFLYSGADGRLIHTLADDPNAVGTLGEGMDGGMDTNGDGRDDLLLSQRSLIVNGVPGSGAVNVLSFDPYLDASDRLISASAGGTIAFALDFPATEAGLDFRLLASTNVLGNQGPGTKPWLTVSGVTIPLVVTPLTYRMWNDPPAAFAGAHGTLDAAGTATVTLALPPGSAASEIGRTFRFAAVSLKANGHASASSAAVLLTIEP